MAIFVLVHGAWHDGSAWDAVVRHLESKGHKAFAPTVAGHGKGARRNVTHADCTRSLLEFITGYSLSHIILMGHSFGGSLISKMAEAIPERIRRLVFQNAFVLRDGLSLLDEVPPETAAGFAQLAQHSPDNMAGSHEVMFTDPQGLAEKILEAGRD